MRFVLSGVAVFAGLSLVSIPAVAQRGGGGAPQPEGCPGAPQWQIDRNAAAAAARGGAGGGGRGQGRGAGQTPEAAAAALAAVAGRGAGGGRGGRGGAGNAADQPVP